MKVRNLRAGRFSVLMLGVCLCWTPASQVHAADKFAAEFLKIGIGARALGMGGAFTALADDASAPYWNPAGATLLTHREALLMHSEQFGRVVEQNSGAFVLPLPESNSAVGVAILHVAVDDIRITKDAKIGEDENGNPILDPNRIYFESARDLGILLTYAKEVSPVWRWGVNIKLIHQSLVDAGSSFGVGADVGVLYHPSESVSFGARFSDVTTTALFWDSGRRETVAPTLILGAAKIQTITALKGSVTAAFDLGLAFESQEGDQFRSGTLSGNIQAGLEYWYRESVALRLGSDAGNIAAGAGVRWNQFGVDYAFMDHDLDGTHRVSALMRF